MTDLDEKLQLLIQGLPDSDGGISDGDMAEGIIQIHQAFTDAGYMTPEQVQKTQVLVNQMANLAQDMVRQPVVTVADFSKGKLANLMTGQEWYNKFEETLKMWTFTADYPDGPDIIDREEMLKVAKRAAELGDSDDHA